MRTFVVISPDLVFCHGANPPVQTLDEVAESIGPREPVLFGIVPHAVSRVLGTDRTIDVLIQQQFPGSYSFRTEPLETNVYQVYVASDELLDRLRAISTDVSIVPYPAAVRQVVTSLQEELATSLRERTRVFIQSIASDAHKPPAHERVAIDVLGEDYLLTALRGQEILAVRLVHGGDPGIESQRTMAAYRMQNPLILTRDEDLALELKSQGYAAEFAEVDGDLVGLSGLDHVLGLRFLTDIEVARERERAKRRRALLVLGACLGLAGASGAVFTVFRGAEVLAGRQLQEAIESRDSQSVRLTELFQERFASMARKESVAISEELFDLSIGLPPQVELVSLQKDASGLTAVVERRPGAVPFSRFDLVSSLADSQFFAQPQIHEEYEGHIVRYTLTVPAAPPASPQP